MARKIKMEKCSQCGDLVELDNISEVMTRRGFQPVCLECLRSVYGEEPESFPCPQSGAMCPDLREACPNHCWLK